MSKDAQLVGRLLADGDEQRIERVFASLTPTQADGLACVVCRADYLTAQVPHRPVGRSQTGSQVFACTGDCAAAGQAPADELPAALPWWQNEPCPAWCVYSPHGDEDTLTDRIHLSSLVGRVQLSLHDRERFFGQEFGRFSTMADPALNLFVLQGQREVAPRIQLCYGESRVTFDLTVGEALELAQELTKGADLAEGHWGGDV